MDALADAGSRIRLHLADRPLLLQEYLDLLEERRAAGATDDELAGLVAELRELRGW